MICLLVVSHAQSVMAGDYFIDIGEHEVKLLGYDQTAILANKTLPGPELHWQEGEIVNLYVTNRLSEQSSIHWHGILLPYDMDGVPGISFNGIAPGQTFAYHFKVKQSGTYWYHGHSAMQEQLGLFGALIIDPADSSKSEITTYTLILSDWPEANPDRTLARLKKQGDYYNFQKRTVFDFFDDIANIGFMPAVKERLAWGRMRMEPTDLADVTGATYHYLINGHTQEQNWTALYGLDQTVRLRFINASAMTHFDIRIPGLKLQITESDGISVKPVIVDEFRIAVAETYDVIVEPEPDRAYTIFAEAMDRSGYARATLTSDVSLVPSVPIMRPLKLLSMGDMESAHMHHLGPANSKGEDDNQHANHQPESHEKMVKRSVEGRLSHRMKRHSSHQLTHHQNRSEESAANHAVLEYKDLSPIKPAPEWGPVDREITLRLTGNMNRYIWSFNDLKYSDAEPIRVKYGEHLRFKYVNETMMNHPIHLHGMWQYLDIGKDQLNPKKHVINVKPGETVEIDVIADAVGEWAFHCHLLYHMETGMFRKLIVEE